MLSQLYIQLQTPLPIRSTLEATAPWVPKTPYNLRELDLQTKAIQGLIRYCIQTPPSSTIQAINQLVKGCQIAIQSAIILTAENKKL